MAKITKRKYYVLRDNYTGELLAAPARHAGWIKSGGLATELGTTILQMQPDRFSNLSERERQAIAIEQWQAKQDKARQ
jgi:hypothetical protein